MNTKQKPLMLDLGCGNKKRPGTIGVDYNARVDSDISHDLNIFPYPFEAESVDRIYIDNCLEHLDRPLSVMEELHRILKPGGEVKVFDKRNKGDYIKLLVRYIKEFVSNNTEATNVKE